MSTMCSLRQELPEFRDLDEFDTDHADRILARQRRQREAEEARQELRATIEDEHIQARMDAIPKLLGPMPETGEEWAERGLKLLEIAMVEGVGINAKAAASYEAACRQRAAWADPNRYGSKVALTNPDGGPLKVLLAPSDELMAAYREKLKQAGVSDVVAEQAQAVVPALSQPIAIQPESTEPD